MTGDKTPISSGYENRILESALEKELHGNNGADGRYSGYEERAGIM